MDNIAVIIVFTFQVDRFGISHCTEIYRVDTIRFGWDDLFVSLEGVSMAVMEV